LDEVFRGILFPSKPARKTQVMDLPLNVFSSISLIAAAVGTRVPHQDSNISTHDANLL
jgi:hypothetical protein